ncbi:MAG TPA: hypothetical protein VHW44_01995 [Pseudonocardiaceae bacterium]|nr:hypothetical protein [Pseudonocardiaceae bacterium]
MSARFGVRRRIGPAAARPVIVIVTLVAAAVGLAACGTQVAGSAQPAPGAPAPTSAPTRSAPGPSSPTPSGSSPSSSAGTLPVDLCGLLSWKDLNYPGVAGATSPTKSGGQQGWSQFCQWSSQQFDAGYTPPPDPQCNNDNSPGSVTGALQCADENAKQLTQIEANSAWVNIAVGWQSGQVQITPSSTYTKDGTTVYLDGTSMNWTCIGVLHWANGTLQVEVQDATKAFGTPCDQATTVINLLISRQPK